MLTTHGISSVKDPRERHPKFPFEEPPQQPPGHETAMITGGDSGIGRAIAIAFAREGANVAISYLPEEKDDAKETLRWVADAKRKGIELGGEGDIRDEGHCREIVERTAKEFATTKGAIVTFTKALAELAMEHGIRVNAVGPGPVFLASADASSITGSVMDLTGGRRLP